MSPNIFLCMTNSPKPKDTQTGNQKMFINVKLEPANVLKYKQLMEPQNCYFSTNHYTITLTTAVFGFFC